MRRLLSITAFALFLSLPVWAQRGGAGHGGGGHGSFGGGHPGGFSGRAGFSGVHMGGGHFSNGMRSGHGFSHGPTHSSHSGFSRGPFLHNGFHGSRFRTRGSRNHCFGYSCRGGYGYPWIYGGFYDPYWWWDSSSYDSSYDEDYERDRAIANEMNEQSLEEQRMLRQEQAEVDRDRYARSASPSRSAPGDEQPGSAIIPSTLLVFRDQHKKEIQNYAIVGQTLWNFAPQHAEKIPLSNLDLPATAKANEDRGLTFQVPASGEAQ
jgi:hypothetical protein